MKIIRKYTAIILEYKTVNKEQKIKLTYGDISGPYYDETSPTKEFDSEQEAVDYAYKFDPYSKWIIIPTIEFNN